MKHVISLIILIISLLILGCQQSYDDSKKKRANTAKESKDSVIIGVAWPDEDDNFVKGALLAEKEINSNGGLLKRPLQLLINDGTSTDYKSSKELRQAQHLGINVAKYYANNSKVIAVIGHIYSNLAIPASIVYENHGIVFISPYSTSSKLTNHNFKYTFQMHPNNIEIGNQLAAYCQKLGYKKIAILYERSNYGYEVTEAFLSNIEQYGIQMAIRRSFFVDTTDFSKIMVELKSTEEFDAIFVATDSTMISKIYQKSRDMNILKPFVWIEDEGAEQFWNLAKEWETTNKFGLSISSTVFNEPKPLAQTFIKKFKQEYGESAKPDIYAALGYDAIKLLEHAIIRTQSTEPIQIAETLRYMEPCQSVTGKYQFQPNGKVSKKQLYFKYLNARGNFEYGSLKNQSTRQFPLCGNVDQDKDTIPNDIDSCPNNTPEEVSKGVVLRGALRGCPIDTDKDKVHDYQDDCPKNSPLEISKGVDSHGCPIDTDKDKILDYQDICFDNRKIEISKGIYEEGTKIGCPIDSDNDGVGDYLDKCPKNSKVEIEKGVDSNGCPVDTDNDKIPDYKDACDNKSEEISKGVYQEGAKIGCPIDSDKDGVADYSDDCPNSSKGEIETGIDVRGCIVKPCEATTDLDVALDLRACPILIETIIKSDTVSFPSKGGRLGADAQAFIEALIKRIDKKMLVKVDIIGHTDSVGSSESNQRLSEARAASISEHLISLGIERDKIQSRGLGETQPIASNNTKDGREKNRRVEITITHFQKKADSK